jgi:hypothetical protein
MAIVLGLTLVASAAQGTGKISGTARNSQDQVLANVKVQLRNVDTGQLVATTRTASDGRFEFTGLNPGSYVVEIVDDSGKIIGLSPMTPLSSGGNVSGLAIVASASGALAGAAAAGGLAAFFATKGGILLLAGLGAGVTAGIIAATSDSSPSK